MFDTSSGAGVAADALIHTQRGLVPACEVVPGDTAFTFDEATRAIRPTTVDQVYLLGLHPIVEVKVETRRLRVTPNAELVALVDRRRPGRKRRRFRREWVRAGELARDAIVGVARKTPDAGVIQPLPVPTQIRDRRARAVTFPLEADVDLMWWAGLYIGDGYIHHSHHRRRVEFAIPGTQPDLRDELADVSERLFSVKARARDQWRMVLPGIRIADFVITVGLGGKALEKRAPSWVFTSPEKERLAFLGGYVDADGMVRTGASRDMGATSANRDLLDDIRRLAITCGIRTTRIWTFTGRHPTDPTRMMTGYRMQFSGDFDRVSCRAAQRQERMHKRRWFHTNTCVGGTTVRSHTSEWLGFGGLDTRVDLGVLPSIGLKLDGGDGVVVDSVIVRI